MPPRKIISVVGNIGAGKSTLLKELATTYQVIPEDVAEWSNDHGTNWLELFYQQPTRWTLTFQMRVLKSLLEAKDRMTRYDASIVLVERSPLDSRHVFFEYHKEKGYITPAEYALYDWYWQRTAWRPDAIIYVETTPARCHERAQQRARAGENGLELSFFEDMDRHYQKLVTNDTIPIFVLNNESAAGWSAKVAAVQEFIVNLP